jgi:hypothetical protein
MDVSHRYGLIHRQRLVVEGDVLLGPDLLLATGTAGHPQTKRLRRRGRRSRT